MLAALILLGLLPLAALPMGETTEPSDAEDDTTETEASTDPAPDTGDLGDDLLDGTESDPAAADGDIQSDAAHLVSVEPDPGTTVLSDFLADVDLVQLDLTAYSETVTAEFHGDDDAAAVSFLLDPEAPTTLVFDGYQTVPSDDIMLSLFDPETGDAVEMSLTDALSSGDIYNVIGPTDPEAPDDPPSGGDDILQPLDPNDEELGRSADLDLNRLLQRDSENLAGRGAALSAAEANGYQDVALGDGDEVLVQPDAVSGSGDVGLSQSVPVFGSDDPIHVIDAGAGNDQITTGAAAAYAFGGAGDDLLAGGGGAAALYGGEGADTLSAGASGAYLDGGSGDDILSGGAGSDILEGGEHGSAETPGDDTLAGGAGDDLLRGGYGADSLSGGDGDDLVDHLGRTEEREIITQHAFSWHVDEAADTLSGGSGDDTLIFDRHDLAAGGAGDDTFWLYHDKTGGSEIAEVADFKVGEDFLRVSLNPQIGENEVPTVDVRPSDDGADGLVIVNGDLIAVLRGAPAATPSDVYVTVEPDIFP